MDDRRPPSWLTEAAIPEFEEDDAGDLAPAEGEDARLADEEDEEEELTDDQEESDDGDDGPDGDEGEAQGFQVRLRVIAWIPGRYPIV